MSNKRPPRLSKEERRRRNPVHPVERMGFVNPVDRAIAIVEDSRQTHVEWIDYLDRWGDDLQPMEEVAGDLDHHREAVANYDHVLEVLRCPPPTVEQQEANDG